ncbi:MAG: flippase-like domain-containing protein [Planctomycetaceae bacterium]|nr:flippase-like domain-containing protein [Planctomycetaceae bacterium]
MNLLRRCTTWLREHPAAVRWPLGLLVLGAVFAFNREAFLNLRTRSVDWRFASAAVLLTVASILLTHVRWFLLVWALDFPFRLGEAIRIGFLGYLFNYIGPGAVGGDLVKALMIARRQPLRRAVAAATVLLDRLIGLIALMILGAVVSWLMRHEMTAPVFETVRVVFTTGAVAGTLGLGILLLPRAGTARWITETVSRLPIVGHLAAEFSASAALYQSRPKVPVSAVLLSLVSHMLMMTAFYCCGRAIAGDRIAGDGVVPGYLEHLVFLPPAQLAGLIPLLPGGIGALEGALEYFYRISGAVEGDGFLTGLAYRVVTIVIGVIAAAFCLGRREEIEAALHSSPDEAPEAAPESPAAGTPPADSHIQQVSAQPGELFPAP